MPNNRNEKVELRLDTNTLRPLSGAGRKLFVETYGCQMNVGDTEIVVSVMQRIYRPDRRGGRYPDQHLLDPRQC